MFYKILLVFFLNLITLNLYAENNKIILASTTSTYDTGASKSGTIGYIINKFVRTEFELGYTKLDHDKAKGTLAITVGGGKFSVG